MSLQVTKPPAAEPVTLDEVKANLRLSSTDDDATITRLITVARVFAEKVTRKSLVSKGYSLSLPRFPWPGEPIRLPVPPVSAVASVAYLDETGASQTWSSAEFLLGLMQIPAVIVPQPGIIYPCTFHADGLNTVTIDFTAGPAPGAMAIPLDAALEGIRQLAAHLYEHPESINAENLKEMPLGIQALLGSDKVYTF